MLFLLILPCTVHCLMQLMVQACMLIHVWLLATSWAVARQIPVHGIFQARVLEWAAISFSRGSSQPRNQTQVSLASYIGRKILYHSATWKAPYVAHNFRLCEIVFSRDRRLPNWCVPCILQHDVSSSAVLFSLQPEPQDLSLVFGLISKHSPWDSHYEADNVISKPTPMFRVWVPIGSLFILSWSTVWTF